MSELSDFCYKIMCSARCSPLPRHSAGNQGAVLPDDGREALDPDGAIRAVETTRQLTDLSPEDGSGQVCINQFAKRPVTTKRRGGYGEPLFPRFQYFFSICRQSSHLKVYLALVPNVRVLCPPAAATVTARLTDSWPRTSEKSSS
jgi:hypothetical protein